jgi:hypothetical protein
MEYAVIILLLFLIVFLGATAFRVYEDHRRRRHGSQGLLKGRREHYGPPPGAYRALSHEELGNRGWPEYPFEYTANTASSISHMIERSA